MCALIDTSDVRKMSVVFRSAESLRPHLCDGFRALMTSILVQERFDETCIRIRIHRVRRRTDGAGCHCRLFQQQFFLRNVLRHTGLLQ